MSKIDIDAKLINYSWLMTHCPPGHYDTSLGPIFLKIDRQTHCETGTMFLTSEVDIDAKLINYSWLMTHCQPGHYDTSLCPNFLEIDRQTHCKTENRFMTPKGDIGLKRIHCDHFSTSPGSKWKHSTYKSKTVKVKHRYFHPLGSKVILSYEQKKYEVNLKHGDMAVDPITIPETNESFML